MEHSPRQMLRHKKSYNKFKELKGTELNKKSVTKKSGKYLNIWKLSNIFLNNPWFTEENTKRIRNYFELDDNENTKFVECS